jgi:glucuronoarabinoxylan endo-1,4-beta-xylanase
MKIKLIFIILAAFLFFNSFGQVATIDFAKEKQVIDGFGASTAWHGQLSVNEANAAFKNENNSQMGLSILRVRIDPNSSQWGSERANAQKAKAAGAMILASPWSPPAAMKTNNNTTGGQLKPESYAAYATHLKNFCTYLANVDVVSLQNEPNIKVDYESCDWTPTQILNFCKENAPSIGKPFMIPEAYNFDFKYSDPVLNDSTANSHISYIGGHIYGAKASNYTNAINKGKRIWMTEHYYDGDTIEECLKMAKEMAECMYFNMNAYVWWYLRQPGCNLMNTGGSLKKKGYTMAQFSKFVRPGFVRVDATYQPKTNVLLVAFKGKELNTMVVVNLNKTAQSLTFNFKNDTITGVKKYVTSRNKNLVDEGVINSSGNSFTDNLEAQSITTYVTQNTATAINEVGDPENLIYPNPFKNEIAVDLNGFGANADAVIYTLAGQVMLCEKTGFAKTFRIGSSLKTGIYILTVSDGKKKMSYKIEKL